MKRRSSVISELDLPYDRAAEVQAEITDAAAKSGPVKTSLDLGSFLRFDGKNSQGRKGKWLNVNNNGGVTISSEIGKALSDGALVELLLNRRGTILVLRESLQGISFRRTHSKRSHGCQVSCKALKAQLMEMDIPLPVRFVAEWDEDLRAWVGRR